MRKTIITAAVVGSNPTKEMNPAVPYTPKEIAESAIESCRAGAAIAHIHVRDPETGKPDSSIELFREVSDRIRQACDVVINLTTSGYNVTGDNVIEKRLEPVMLHPEICSLDIGSVNFVNASFVNSPEWGRAAAARMREQGVKPEIEAFDAGHMRQAVAWVEEGLFDDAPYFDGHIRVGFEDNIYLRKGVRAKSNAQMVEMAVSLVETLQHEVATPDDARRILCISNGILD